MDWRLEGVWETGQLRRLGRLGMIKGQEWWEFWVS